MFGLALFLVATSRTRLLGGRTILGPTIGNSALSASATEESQVISADNHPFCSASPRVVG
jgi:hypothetical protein